MTDLADAAESLKIVVHQRTTWFRRLFRRGPTAMSASITITTAVYTLRDDTYVVEARDVLYGGQWPTSIVVLTRGAARLTFRRQGVDVYVTDTGTRLIVQGPP